LGFSIRCKVLGARCRVQDAGCRVQGAGCRVQGAGCDPPRARKPCAGASRMHASARPTCTWSVEGLRFWV